MQQLIHFTVPLSKSYQTTERGEPQYILEGVASDETPDQQTEVVLQKGVNLQPLMDYGFINWDHRETPDCLIGEPLQAEIRPHAQGGGTQLFVKGQLYVEDKKQAKEAWQLAQATERHGGRRKIGWSLQGGIDLRDPQRKQIIVKSTVSQLALTHQPVNANTWASLAKSLATGTTEALQLETINAAITHEDGTLEDMLKAMALQLSRQGQQIAALFRHLQVKD